LTSNGHRGRQKIPDSNRAQFSQDFASQRGMFPQRESSIGYAPRGRLTSTQQNTEQNQTRQAIGDRYIHTANGYVRPYLFNQYNTQTYGGENRLSSPITTTAPHFTFSTISYTTFSNYYTTTITPHLQTHPPQLYNPFPIPQQAVPPISNRNYHPAPGQGFFRQPDHAY
jgi:hypothetical protein